MMMLMTMMMMMMLMLVRHRDNEPSSCPSIHHADDWRAWLLRCRQAGSCRHDVHVCHDDDDVRWWRWCWCDDVRSNCIPSNYIWHSYFSWNFPARWWCCWCDDDSCIEFKCLWSHCHCYRTCLGTTEDHLYARESADGSEGDTASLSIKSMFNMWVIRPSTLFAHQVCWIRSWWCSDSFDNRPSSLLTDAA